MDSDRHEPDTPVVGVFSEAAATGPVHAPDPELDSRKVDRVGGQAVRRATIGALLGALVGAVGGAGIAAAAGAEPSTVLAAALGAVPFVGAIGALWGAFIRMGRNDDWREAMPGGPDRPDVVDPSGAEQDAVPVDAGPLVDRGAVEVQVEDPDHHR